MNKLTFFLILFFVSLFSFLSVFALETTIPVEKTLDEQVKEKQIELNSILDKDQVTKQIEEQQKNEISLQVKEENLNQLTNDIKKTIDSLKTDIQEKETLKVKLDIEQTKSEDVKNQVIELEKKVTELKKQLKEKERELSEAIPKLQAELNVLKQENKLAITQLVSLKQKDSEAEKLNFNQNLVILIGVYSFFIFLRLLGTYINRRYRLEKYQQYLQVFYIFSTIFLSLFSVVMIFIFNKELLVSLFFLGGAIILTLKEYSLSFLASIISVKSFSLGTYLTINGKTGIVSRQGLMSFSINIVDKLGRRTDDVLRVSNSVLLGDKELIGSTNYEITEELQLKDILKFKNGYIGIKHLVESVFSKYNIKKYELIDLYDEKHGIKIVWTQSYSNLLEVKGVLLSKISEIEYNEYIYEVKTIDTFKDLLDRYSNTIERKERTYKVTIKVLKSQETQFLKDRENFLK